MPICEKCGKQMQDVNFYTYKNGQKTELCKSCLTMHIDNFNPDTFLWLLEKMDVPYIPEEWNTLRDRAFAKNPNLNGTSVFGKYLSKMKLKQFKDYSWADTEKIQALNEERLQANNAERAAYDEEIKKRFEDGEISEAEYKTLTSTSSQNAATELQHINNLGQPQFNGNNPYNENNFVPEDQLPDLAAELTDEDKTYLLMKWGRFYTPNEWIELEKTYNEMTNSFDIQDADTINTLLLICKTNLKMNQSLDSGDIEGFQKLSKVSESLRKSAKFTAAQNKETKEDFVDCIGNMVAYCEEKGGQIPKYELNYDLDLVDKVISDMKDYTKNLIYEDKALAKQIEDYLKKRDISEQQKKDKALAKEKGQDEIILEDEDYQEYYENVEEQKQLDKTLLEEGE
jgi:hypothetical protein